MRISILITFFFLMGYISNIFADIQNDEDQKNLYGTAGLLEITTRGIPKLVEYGLKGGVKLSRRLLKTELELPDIPFGPDLTECTPEKFKARWFWQNWQECWGIPQYFLDNNGDNDTPKSWGETFTSWGSNFKFIPTVFNISSPQVEEVDFGPFKLNCNGFECLIEIPLWNLKLKGGLDVSIYQEGELQEYFKIDDLVLRINRDYRSEKYPSIKAQVQFNPSGEIDQLVTIMNDSLTFDLEGGEFSITHSKEGHAKTITDFFSYLLSNGSGPGSGRDRFAKILNETVAPIAIQEANILIAEAIEEYVRNLQLELPELNVQDMLDEDTLDKRFEDIDKQFEGIFLSLSQILRGSGGLKTFKHSVVKPFLQRELKIYFETMEFSARSIDIEHLRTVNNNLIRLCKKVAPESMATKNKGFFSKVGHSLSSKFGVEEKVIKVKNIKDAYVKECLLRREELREVKQKVQSLNDQKNVKLDLNFSVNKIFGDNTHSLFLGLGFPDEDRVIRPINYAPFDLDYKDSKEFDFSLQVNIDALNLFLRDLNKKKYFDFCYSGDELSTCGNSNSELEMTFKRAPQIHFDEKGLYIEASKIRLRGNLTGLTTGKNTGYDISNEANFKMYINPKPCGNGICLNPNMDVDVRSFLSSDKPFRSMESFLRQKFTGFKFLSKWAARNYGEDYVDDLLNEVEIPQTEITEDFSIPEIIFVKIEIDQDNGRFLKVYCSLP